MRLICPNCGAQYDVPDDAVPPAGREVQCSSCGHTWFEIETPALSAKATAAAATPQETTVVVPPESPPTQPETIKEPRPRIDDSIKAILREEAARESALAEPAQPKEAPAADTVAPARRIVQVRRNDDTLPAAVRVPVANPEPGSRDIPSMDDINARLRARSDAAGTSLTAEEQQEAVARRGFRSGFVMVLLLFAILIAPYIFADQITAAVPQIQDGMTAYVAIVDQLRLTLNAAIANLAERVADLVTSE
ncbi:MAG: zinc-ribbon domain-containing protein [Loktanella sp.]|nr:zinc-ribbon domain-containing protein [Loktanella sp.]